MQTLSFRVCCNANEKKRYPRRKLRLEEENAKLLKLEEEMIPYTNPTLINNESDEGPIMAPVSEGATITPTEDI